MQCPNCNEQLPAGADGCPHCGHSLTVTVLSKRERDGFNGVTIDEGSGDSRQGRYDSYEAAASPRMKRINLSFGSSGWGGNLLMAGVLALLLFFFLPVLLFVLLLFVAAGVGIWLLRRLIK